MLGHNDLAAVRNPGLRGALVHLLARPDFAGFCLTRGGFALSCLAARVIGRDARIPLMRGLAGGYTLTAAGTSRGLARPFRAADFGYYYYPLYRGTGPLADLQALATLRRLLVRLRPDVVHAFDTKPGVYGCLAARLAKVPVVVGTVTGLGSL